MKVCDMIDWLKTQNQNAEVHVMVYDENEKTECFEYDWREFNTAYSAYVDWSKNLYVAGTKFENRKILYLGQKE